MFSVFADNALVGHAAGEQMLAALVQQSVYVVMLRGLESFQARDVTGILRKVRGGRYAEHWAGHRAHDERADELEMLYRVVAGGGAVLLAKGEDTSV